MDKRFERSRCIRSHFWMKQDGKCNLCECILQEHFHLDHIIPWSLGGLTTINNLQALCPKCNLIKGNKIMQLRSHQQKVLTIIEEIVKNYWLNQGVLKKKNLFISAFPGSGKSILPIIIFKILKKAGIVDKLCWVVPRKSLRKQAAEEFGKIPMRELLDHNLEIREIDTASEYNPCRDTDGFVTTYQALAAANKSTKTKSLHNMCNYEFNKHRYLLFLDEFHHLTANPNSKSQESKIDYNWYCAVKPLADACKFMAGVSGTPYRHEATEKIAFLEYVANGEGKESAVFDVEYGLQDSVKDEAVINLIFQTMELASVSYKKNGEQVEKNCFENGTDVFVALASEYGKKILNDGLTHWQDYRLNIEPRSKCIIVCASQDECRTVRDIVAQRGLQFALAISDEKNAYENIERFKKDNNCNVLITCQMAYEGLDCIQATHLICLSLIRSLPFLVQMFTRVMRFDRHSNLKYQEQNAFAFVPTDKKMMAALDFVNATKLPLVCKQDELDDLLFPLIERDISSPPTIENMKSAGLGFGQVDLITGRELDHELRNKVQLWQIKNKIKANELDTYEFLQKRGLLHELDETKSLKEIGIVSAHDIISETPREREKNLRTEINRLANKADYRFGCKKGTWNKKTLNKFTKRRKEMTEKELYNALVWLKSEVKAEHNKLNMPLKTALV